MASELKPVAKVSNQGSDYQKGFEEAEKQYTKIMNDAIEKKDQEI